MFILFYDLILLIIFNNSSKPNSRSIFRAGVSLNIHSDIGVEKCHQLGWVGQLLMVMFEHFKALELGNPDPSPCFLCLVIR